MVTTGESQRDYVQVAVDYAKAAVADVDRLKHGRLIRLAAKRFLDDLERASAEDPPFIFDEWQANDPCDFIEKLPHIEGVWDTPNIIMHASHIFFVVQLFGFRNLDGGRRYTSALFAVARKNAKSTLSAAILLYCLCCEDEPGAQVISAATTYDQASIIFKVAKAMADKTKDLRDNFGLESWSKSISRFETGSSFKALHAKASTQDGLNPSHVGLDEIHAHKTPDLLNVLTSAAGARKSPLWLYTTTEGYTNPGPWAEIRVFAKQLLNGVFKHEADHFLVVFYCVDEENKAEGIVADDDFDESAWIKANPLIEVNPHLLSAIRKESVEAKSMPSKMAEFKIKRLNRPAASADGWIDLIKWGQCGGEVDIAWLERYPCFAGLDLSSTRDLTSFRLVWKVDDVYYTWGRRWVPEQAVFQRTERGTVPYQSWVESGFIEQTPGNAVDYRVIEQAVRDACARFKIEQINFDSWNAADISIRLLDDGYPMVEFIQGPKSYHPAMQALEVAYIEGNLRHGGDPVLNWCASNVVARRDINLNMAPDKKNSAEKIDDMAALLMAMGAACFYKPVGSLSDFLSNPVSV